MEFFLKIKLKIKKSYQVWPVENICYGSIQTLRMLRGGYPILSRSYIKVYLFLIKSVTRGGGYLPKSAWRKVWMFPKEYQAHQHFILNWYWWYWYCKCYVYVPFRCWISAVRDAVKLVMFWCSYACARVPWERVITVSRFVWKVKN